MTKNKNREIDTVRQANKILTAKIGARKMDIIIKIIPE